MSETTETTKYALSKVTLVLDIYTIIETIIRWTLYGFEIALIPAIIASIVTILTFIIFIIEKLEIQRWSYSEKTYHKYTRKRGGNIAAIITYTVIFLVLYSLLISYFTLTVKNTFGNVFLFIILYGILSLLYVAAYDSIFNAEEITNTSRNKFLFFWLFIFAIMGIETYFFSTVQSTKQFGELRNEDIIGSIILASAMFILPTIGVICTRMHIHKKQAT